MPLPRETFPNLFTTREVGSLTCLGCYCPKHGTDGFKSPPKDCGSSTASTPPPGTHILEGGPDLPNQSRGRAKNIHGTQPRTEIEYNPLPTTWSAGIYTNTLPWDDGRVTGVTIATSRYSLLKSIII